VGYRTAIDRRTQTCKLTALLPGDHPREQYVVLIVSDAPRDHAEPWPSFVIPAFNEERSIGRTIESIHAAMAGRWKYEINVVDNGSTDDTRTIASRLGARVFSRIEGTIGSIRNAGVQQSRGNVIVFLDADVVLTDAWAARFPETLLMLNEHPSVVTGSICGVPADAGWLERLWFGARRDSASSHIGTGHMIMTRSMFERIGGFDETLATGEDYELSRRAVAEGGSIVLDVRLRVEHLGFPRTLGMFLKREMWHGRSDFRSVSSILSSRVAIAALIFLFLHLVLILSLGTGSFALAAGALAAISILCFGSSVWKYRGQPLWVIALNAGLFWLYYLGRALAPFRRKPAQRHGTRAL
jgi:glycosyltransferase involved in cell wall biosynthesis